MRWLVYISKGVAIKTAVAQETSKGSFEISGSRILIKTPTNCNLTFCNITTGVWRLMWINWFLKNIVKLQHPPKMDKDYEHS